MSRIKTTIREQLQAGNRVQTFTTGTSMEPLLYDHKTWVIIEPATEPLKPGDLAIYQCGEGHYVIHRIIRVEDGFYHIRGDNNIDGENVPREFVLGRVEKIYRGGKPVNTAGPSYQCYTALYVPARRFYRRVCRKLHRMLKGGGV